MNNVVLMGRMARDPETRYTQSDMCVSRFSLAVDRRGKREEGKQNADFISCVAFKKTGEFVEKYGKKGMKFVLRGHIQTGSYEDKDGKKVYTTDVVVDEIEFAESKAAASGSAPAAKKESEEFMQIPEDAEDGGLPWN